MKLKYLHLHNIRSYKDHSIKFTEGISLFEGDIGSGKSSILSGIEFALFGLGNLSGSHLLRVGENEGSVRLTLEVNEREYVFGRSLIRSRGKISQSECFIIEEGVRTTYNATDMKRRALQILNFREPVNPRSHSIIYRFAIFTPQEQMKEVISQRPDKRKETLRKAFGIEEYSIAAGNAEVVRRGLHTEFLALKTSEVEIEEIKERMEVEESEREAAREKISDAHKELKKSGAEIEQVVKAIKEKEEEAKKLRELYTRIEVLNHRKTQLLGEIDEGKEKISGIMKKLDEAEQAENLLRELEPGYVKNEELKKEIQDLEPKYMEYSEKEHRKELIQLGIQSERKSLEDRLNSATSRLNSIKKRTNLLEISVKEIPLLQAKAEQLEREISPLRELRKKHTEAREQIQTVKQEIRQLLESKNEKEGEWRNIESLGVGAQCPRCQQRLTEEHYEIIEAKYRDEIKELNDRLENARQTQSEHEVNASQINDRIAETEGKLTRLQDLRLRMEGKKTQEKTLQTLKEDEREVSSEVNKIENLLRGDNFAKEMLEQIEETERELIVLRPHAERYITVKNQLEKYEKDEIERRYLESKAVANRKPEYKEQRVQLEQNLKRAEADLFIIRADMKEKSSEYEEKKKVIDELESYRGKHTSLLQKKTRFETIISGATQQMARISDRIESLKKELKRHKTNLSQADILSVIRSWLEGAFIPSLRSIERSVLLNLNQEFNRLFKRWFSDLIEIGELNGLIDEEFTPIVEQGGYELEMDSLSGGEKTSVALAYRLALNTIVKQVTDTMKSNLLVLDEPTDGFSREQLHKMRDILNDVNCDQIIMVSHEAELENVADHIYMVTKEGNTSTVTGPR